MARIRSVHPGLWTDEAFIELSAHARVLLIGIWTECFDDGVFEWKPKRLKVRVLPADTDIDIDALLAELVEHECVQEFDADGRRYGLVRNFCKFQRPKKPSESGVLPNQFRTYVGLEPVELPTSSEPVPNQFGTVTEFPPQKGGREEGRKGEEEKKQSIDCSKKADEKPEVPKKPKRQPPKSRIDPGWFPDEAGFEYAVSEGIERMTVYDEVEKFKDHHASKGSLMADWPAAWRTWARNSVQYAAERQQRQQSRERAQAWR